MEPHTFILLSILNSTLREGSILARKEIGAGTELWKRLRSLTPKETSTGWVGDAAFFLAEPVQLPMKKFQFVLRELSERSGITPTPGEHLTDSFIPRLTHELVLQLEQSRMTPDGLVEITPEANQIITPMDAIQLRELIINVFNLNDMPAEAQDDLIDTIGQLVFDGVMTKATMAMTEEEFAEFEKIVDSQGADAEAVLTYLEQILPDFDRAVADEVAAVKEEFDRADEEGDENEGK